MTEMHCGEVLAAFASELAMHSGRIPWNRRSAGRCPTISAQGSKEVREGLAPQRWNPYDLVKHAPRSIPFSVRVRELHKIRQFGQTIVVASGYRLSDAENAIASLRRIAGIEPPGRPKARELGTHQHQLV